MPHFYENALPVDENCPKTVRFSLTMARALHSYGLPTHRLESTMADIHKKLGINGEFFAAPSSIIASFGREENSRTYIMKPMGDDLNLEKLEGVLELALDVATGRTEASDAQVQLEQLIAAPDRYGMYMTIMSLVVSSCGAARLFGGGWREVVVSGAVGLFLALVLLIVSRLEGFARIIPPLAAVGAMTLAQLALVPLGPYSVYISTVTGLIVLLPGLSLTVGVTELATGHPISGSARVANAVVAFLMIGFGIALGGQVANFLPDGAVPGSPLALPDWSLWPALAVVPLSFVVLFKAHPKDTHWVFLACILAFQSARWGSTWFGPELGTFLASFILAAAANTFARISHRPASIMMVPGVMLLVPGSVGYKSLSSMLSQNTLSGVESAFTMILLAVALVSGILFAGGMVPNRSNN